jgi:hypothetical protein
MGCGSSSNIVINLDRPNPFYFSGEILSGTVQLYVTDDKLQADEIDLNLIGEIGYTTTHTVTDAHGRRSTTTQHHNVPFLKTKTVFARPETGDNALTYTQGQYSWRFQIQLMDYLPPTLNQPQSYPYVRYYLQFVIDKAWYKPNTRENRYITIFPRVNLLQQPQNLMATMFGSRDRKDITLKGTLNKLGFVPGEMIMATIEIENPRQVLIKQIDASMIKTYQIGPNSCVHTVFRITIPELMNQKDERITQTTSLMIPAIPLAPSYQFQGGTGQAVFVQVNYVLKFEVKVEGMFTNFEATVPMILGTEPNPTLPQQQRIG